MALNTITINNIDESDHIPDDIISEADVVTLQKAQINFNELTNSRIRFFQKKIFILNCIGLKFYCYDFKGNLQYSIDLSKKKDPGGKNYKISDFLIKSWKEIRFIVSDRSTLLFFEKNELKDTLKFNFWAKELEQLKNGEYLFYQDFVNDRYGKPSHVIKTNSSFEIKETYLPTSDMEANMANKNSTVMYNMFKSGENINILQEQFYNIFRYPDFSKAYYYIDFLKYKFSPLDAGSHSLNNKRKALLNSFWEISNTINFSYFFETKPNFVFYNKETKSLLKTKDLNSVNRMILSNIKAVNEDFFISVVSSDVIKEISKISDKTKMGVLRNLDLHKMPSANPILISFKLRRF